LRALILAGGYGTRLGELTKSTPKILIEIGGVPIIDRTIGKLTEIGITEITINTHYLAETVTEYLNSRFTNLNLRVVFEPKLLGTAGTLKKNIDWLAVDDFIVMHGDNFFTDNLFGLAKGKLDSKNLLRACPFITNTPQNCGVFTVKKKNAIVGFDEKNRNATSNIANAAIYRFSKDIHGLVTNLSEVETDISVNFLPTILDKVELHMLKDHFIDIGTQEGIDRADLVAKRLEALRN